MAEAQESLHFLDYWRVIRSRKEIAIAVFLLVVLTGFLVTYMMPKVYRASTIIAVREETPDVHVFSQQVKRYDPLFLRTQFEIIQSRPVIEETIRKLNLNEKLARAYGYNRLPQDKIFERSVKILSKRMKVQQYRDTNLIEIQIYMEEPKATAPQEAANAANMIAAVYRDLSVRKSRESTERALKALHESLEEQNDKVDKAQRKLEEIREKYKIAVVDRLAGTGGSLEKMSVAQLEAMRIKVRTQLARKETRHRQIQGLSHADLLDAAPYIVGDPALAALVANKRNSEVELSRLSKAMGPKHPEVVRVEAMIKELDKKIEDALNGLKTGVQADYEAEKASYEIIETELENMKADERSAEALGYLEFDKAREEVEHLKRIRDGLEMRHIQEKIEMHIPRTIVEVVEEAKPPDKTDPVRPNHMLNIILSILAGLGSGIGLAFFTEYLDTSVKTIEDIESYLRVPVLGVIPQKVRSFMDEEARGMHAEGYRVLRTNIQFSKKLKDGKTFCFTSGSIGEGKTLTLFNLAYVYAQSGDRVLIVDSDLHRPKLHKILRIPNIDGLANVLIGKVELEDAIITTSISNLDFLSSGNLSSGAHGLLSTTRTGELVRKLREKYDAVFFDTPPIIGVSDASLLAREMDGVLLVIQHRKYPKSVSNRAKTVIENMGANLIGVVLNNINLSRDYSYYYNLYYSYPPVSERPAET